VCAGRDRRFRFSTTARLGGLLARVAGCSLREVRVSYQIRLVGPDTRLDAPTMGDLLEALFQGNLRALRMRVEGRSRGSRGALPQWLREAASFELAGLSGGSVLLQVEAAPLAEVLPPGLLGLLPPPLIDKPCAALFAESLNAALAEDDAPLLYDQSLVETFISLSRVFASGVESLELGVPSQEPWARLRVTDVEKLRRLQQRLATSAERTVELTGVLAGVDQRRRRYTLRPDEGLPVEGFADDLLIDQIGPLLGERVTVTGTAIAARPGEVVRLVTESIQRAKGGSIPPGSDPGARGRLARFTLHGYKSIRHLEDLALGPINVLIGANGAGKSNLISFFELLESLAAADGVLPTYVTSAGGADTLLHDGAATTPEIRAALTFETAGGEIDYAFRLASGAPDTLLFAEEKLRLSRPAAEAPWTVLGAGHRDSGLHRTPDTTARAVLGMLRRTVTYQFHNTSDTARIRRRWGVGDGLTLKPDAANLAPFLFRLRESRRDAYDRIVETIRQIVPFFADFHLDPTPGTMLLQWRERNTDIVFQPQQASDGMLRAMALVTLLLQPYEDLPSLIIVDEPELGLHPYAIGVVAGLFRSASHHAQVILATQSTTFLDLFEPDEIIVVDRRDRESHLKRLDPGGLQQWLEEYSLGELWEKNVLGGRPAR
jgi:predicted ATPase